MDPLQIVYAKKRMKFTIIFNALVFSKVSHRNSWNNNRTGEVTSAGECAGWAMGTCVCCCGKQVPGLDAALFSADRLDAYDVNGSGKLLWMQAKIPEGRRRYHSGA